MNLSKLQSQRKALIEKMTKLQEEYHEKSAEYGTLSHTSRSDPSFSAARYDNLEKDLAKLQEQKDDLNFELDELTRQIRIASLPPPTPAEEAAKKAKIARDERRQALEADLAKVRADLAKRRASLGKDVLDGGDPAALVIKIGNLEAAEAGLKAALGVQ